MKARWWVATAAGQRGCDSVAACFDDRAMAYQWIVTHPVTLDEARRRAWVAQGSPRPHPRGQIGKRFHRVGPLRWDGDRRVVAEPSVDKPAPLRWGQAFDCDTGPSFAIDILRRALTQGGRFTTTGLGASRRRRVVERWQ